MNIKYYLKTKTYNQVEINDKLALKLNATAMDDFYNKAYINHLSTSYYTKGEVDLFSLI